MSQALSDCLEPIDVPAQVLLDLGMHPDEVDEVTIHRGAGCRACNGSGYRGRIAVYEIMTMTDELREFVLNGASTLELKREAVRQGMQTLRMSALNKLKSGVTSLDEVGRMTADD